MALLKRFKVTDELEGGVPRGAAALRNDRELDALFQELESLSVCENDDSGPDMDTLSVGSTPKPSLRPFFSSSKAVLNDSLGGNLKNPTFPNTLNCMLLKFLVFRMERHYT